MSRPRVSEGPLSTSSRRRRRNPWNRLRQALLPAVTAVLTCVLPAAATNGTVWTTLAPLPAARDFLGAAAAPCPPGQTGTCVYAMGGRDALGNATTPSSVSGRAESFNRLTNAWSTVRPMPTPRWGFGTASAPCPPGQTGTCVYTVGGYTAFALTGPDVPVATVESYNPVTNAWSTVAALPAPRGSLAAAAAPCPPGQTGTCVYAVGGADGTGTPLGQVHSYNPVTNAWSQPAPLPTPRLGLAAAASTCPPGQSGFCVYAMGGVDGTGTIQATVRSYNPATNAWSPVEPLPTGRYLLAAAAAPCPPGQTGTCVYAVGGRSGPGFNTTGAVESYNAASNAWTTLPALPTARSHLAAAAMQCPPGQGATCVYATGGSSPTGLQSTVDALDPPLDERR
ncbi:Kelch repeat-containing protein [Streptomyces sp. NPDC058746]|uniref:Kelch repeat-containing protein n=1 Tax=Streptomyces sp. NPDC058746 TaxID=3346622 RepID=UPI0036A2FBFD